MVRETRQQLIPATDGAPACIMPAGAPDWVTSELLTKTLAVWQPYYQKVLTVDDALGMILDVANLCDVLSREPP